MDKFNSIKDKPLILSGHPKSGTTLLLALLDGHPELCVFPEELKFLQKVVGSANKERVLIEQTGLALLTRGLVKFESGTRDYSDVSSQQVINKVNELVNSNLSDRDLLVEIMRTWCHLRKASDHKDLKYWVEKTPHNERYIPIYKKWFNNVKFIHMIRDPRDNYAAYKKKQPNLTLQKFTENWAISAEIGLRSADSSNYLLLKYEDLVSSPRHTLLQICDYLGIEFDANLTLPTRNLRPWEGNSMDKRDYTSISTSSLGKFRTQLTQEEIYLIDSRLGTYMEKFGYMVGERGKNSNCPLIQRKVYRHMLFSQIKYNVPFLADFYHRYVRPNP